MLLPYLIFFSDTYNTKIYSIVFFSSNIQKHDTSRSSTLTNLACLLSLYLAWYSALLAKPKARSDFSPANCGKYSFHQADYQHFLSATDLGRHSVLFCHATRFPWEVYHSPLWWLFSVSHLPDQLMPLSADDLALFSLKWQIYGRNKSHSHQCNCEKIHFVFSNLMEFYLSHSTDGRKLNSTFFSNFRIFSVPSNSVHLGLLSSLYSSQSDI